MSEQVIKTASTKLNMYVSECRGQRISGAIPALPQYAFMAW